VKQEETYHNICSASCDGKGGGGDTCGDEVKLIHLLNKIITYSVCEIYFCVVYNIE